MELYSTPLHSLHWEHCSRASQRSITTMFTRIASPDAMRQAFDRQGYIEALIGIFTRRRTPFAAIELDEMKALALSCNPYIEDQLITSRRTIMRYLDANYELYAQMIKESLSTSSSPIHISSDLWTSPSRHSMLAICAQWVDKDYKLQNALLALPECRDSHSGEQQAKLILQTFEKYNITSKLGWHTGYNATSNDTCLEHIECQLKIKYNVGFSLIQLSS